MRALCHRTHERQLICLFSSNAPCAHIGPCTVDTQCACSLNGAYCTRSCRCATTCAWCSRIFSEPNADRSSQVLDGGRAAAARASSRRATKDTGKPMHALRRLALARRRGGSATPTFAPHAASPAGTCSSSNAVPRYAVASPSLVIVALSL